MAIEYSHDGPDLLGTAGAIRQALPLLKDSFFVLYGDSYLPCDYRSVEEAFRRAGLPGLMTVYRNDGRYDGSNVEYDGKRILRNRLADEVGPGKVLRIHNPYSPENSLRRGRMFCERYDMTIDPASLAILQAAIDRIEAARRVVAARRAA